MDRRRAWRAGRGRGTRRGVLIDLPSGIMTDSAAHRPTLLELFRGFLMLGLMGFGGVLPLSRHMLVEQRRWLTAREFTDLLGLCQFLPGGNIINVSVAVGMQFRGVPGAFATLLGLIAAPTAIVIVLGSIYARFQSNPHVVHMFA